jgi:nucleoside-diphosphate-sugar epimerase
MMHVLLTGAGSFIGLIVAEVLAKAGLRVTATYRGESTSVISRCEFNYPNVKFKCIDITNIDSFSSLPARVDAVIHMAAIAPSSIASMDEMLLCNVIGSRNVQQYGIAAEAKCIIYLSSLSVYGNIEDPIVDENTRINNPELYGAGKYFAERMFASTSDDVSTFAIRLPGVVGMGAFRSWIPKLVLQLQAGLPIKIYASETPFNSVVHVSDLANLILDILQKPSLGGFHAFPIAASGEMSKGKIVNFLHEKLHSKSSISMEIGINRYYFISSKYARDKFGYCPMHIEDLLYKYSSECMTACNL